MKWLEVSVVIMACAVLYLIWQTFATLRQAREQLRQMRLLHQQMEEDHAMLVRAVLEQRKQ